MRCRFMSTNAKGAAGCSMPAAELTTARPQWNALHVVPVMPRGYSPGSPPPGQMPVAVPPDSVEAVVDETGCLEAYCHRDLLLVLPVRDDTHPEST